MQISANNIFNIQLNIQIEAIIKSVFNEDTFKYGKTFKRVCKQNQQTVLKIIQFYQLNFKSIFSTFKDFIKCVIFPGTYYICIICGKVFNKKRSKRSKNLYCTLQCMHKDKQMHIKHGQTYRKNNIDGKHSIKMKQIWQNKMSDPAQKQKFKNTIKNAVQQKYGVDNVYQLQNIKEKRNQTMKQRYGVQQAMQSQQLKNRFLDSIQKNNSFNTQQYKERFITSMRQKYGVSYAMQSQEIRNKALINNKQKYGVSHPNNLIVWEKIQNCKDIIQPLFSKQQYSNKDGIYQWKCVKCGNIFEDSITSHHLKNIAYRLPRCPHCYPHLRGYSNEQKQLAQFCKQYFPNLQQNNRQLIKPYQLDIVIPQIKLAIEFNGIYWHSLEMGTQQTYHLDKVLACNQKGYRLLHIWQDQWIENCDDLKQKLVAIFQNRQIVEQKVYLDFSWYNGPDFNIVKVYQPQIQIRDKFQIVNCGYIDIME